MPTRPGIQGGWPPSPRLRHRPAGGRCSSAPTATPRRSLAAHIGAAASPPARGCGGASGRGGWCPPLVVDGVVMAHLLRAPPRVQPPHRLPRPGAPTRSWRGWCGVIVGCRRATSASSTRPTTASPSRPDLDPELIDVPADRRRYAPVRRSASRTGGGRTCGSRRRAPAGLRASFVPPAECPASPRGARVRRHLRARRLVSIDREHRALWLWLLPRLVGEPAMRVARLSEHAGRPRTADVTENTRSLRVPLPLRLLAWNMPFHAEHHAAPSVPFHALPPCTRRPRRRRRPAVTSRRTPTSARDARRRTPSRPPGSVAG